MIQNTGTHRMNRRSCHNDYRTPGIYHITIRTNGNLRLPLGTVVGSCEAAPGSADEPRVALNSIGAMVEQELTTSISAHYPMIEIQDYVVMPDHLHFIVNVRNTIVSARGRYTHLGQVIAGFKKGCNRRFWEIKEQRGEPSATDGRSCLPVFPEGYKVPSTATTGRTPLFEEGYVDVMPLGEGQLEQQRQYIRNNPRSRLLRSKDRERLQTKRQSITTALSLRALHKYLQAQCSPTAFNDTIWHSLRARLMTTCIPAGMQGMQRREPSATDAGAGVGMQRREPSATDANTATAATVNNGMVTCDSYGELSLTNRRMLPVVCHRKDVKYRSQQLQACLEAAERGAVLVSARIAEGEKTIIDKAISMNYPVILLVDNGFPDVFHPSEVRIQQCAEGQLLLVSPWRYHYRIADEGITVAECKAMNCVVQSLCRLSDDWWKQ